MKKTFDCVKMMRDIRTKLSRRYRMHPELLERDLEEIRKKIRFPRTPAQAEGPVGGRGASRVRE